MDLAFHGNISSSILTLQNLKLNVFLLKSALILDILEISPDSMSMISFFHPDNETPFVQNSKLISHFFCRNIFEFLIEVLKNFKKF